MTIKEAGNLLDIEDKHIVGLYQFGSVVYGTQTPKSDEDFICIVSGCKYLDSTFISANINISIYEANHFEQMLFQQDIVALECYFLPPKHIIRAFPMQWNLDKGQLRKSISTVSNHSWIKGKKKLTVASDYQKIIGIKSIFHSLRILDFALQILETNRIYDYQKNAFILFDLHKLAQKHERSDLWNIIESKYKSQFKNAKQALKHAVPKHLMEHNGQKQALIQILKSYKIVPQKALVKDILELFE